MVNSYGQDIDSMYESSIADEWERLNANDDEERGEEVWLDGTYIAR